jgi:hypothetical protein
MTQRIKRLPDRGAHQYGPSTLAFAVPEALVQQLLALERTQEHHKRATQPTDVRQPEAGGVGSKSHQALLLVLAPQTGEARVDEETPVALGVTVANSAKSILLTPQVCASNCAS